MKYQVGQVLTLQKDTISWKDDKKIELKKGDEFEITYINEHVHQVYFPKHDVHLFLTESEIDRLSGRVRGFEIVSEYQDKGINLPKRQSKNAAGYDFEAAETVKIYPFIYLIAKKVIFDLFKGTFWNSVKEYDVEEYIKPTLVPTGVKAYMQEDEALFLYNRSSNPLKRGLVLANSVGVVDSDYYNNPDNEGHIMFAFYNFGLFPVTIKKGERIGQGIFKKFLKADNDQAGGERQGGFGSTGK
jgi:dUTP pyrophosphatase